MSRTWDLPQTQGAPRRSRCSQERIAAPTLKDEIRENLIARLDRAEPLFPGIVGFEDTVVPQIVNAILSRHNFTLLGRRGWAKTRLIRMLTSLLDDHMPYIADSEIRDNPYPPIGKYARQLIEDMGEERSIAWLSPGQRHAEKLATPDVTIAGMIGDDDPIQAAHAGPDIFDEIRPLSGLEIACCRDGEARPRSAILGMQHRTGGRTVVLANPWNQADDRSAAGGAAVRHEHRAAPLRCTTPPGMKFTAFPPTPNFSASGRDSYALDPNQKFPKT